MMWDPDAGGDFQSCRGALGDLLAGTWHLEALKIPFSRPCATPLRERMDKNTVLGGFLTGRSLLCTKAAHMKALEEKK